MSGGLGLLRDELAFLIWALYVCRCRKVLARQHWWKWGLNDYKKSILLLSSLFKSWARNEEGSLVCFDRIFGGGLLRR